MLRTWVIGVVMVFGLAGGARAQVPPREPDGEQIKARQKIFMMEGVLERAVQLGVENLRRRVRAVVPDDALLQGGAPQVRGFRLEGYGIFFDVEVPALRRSLAWSLRTMNRTGMGLARDLAQMRAFVQAIPDPRVRAEFERTLRRIEMQAGPTPQVAAERVAADSVAVPQDADPLLLSDPSEAYTQEVRAAVIEAMIENSGPLMLADDEWLTVAARDNAPGDSFMTADPDVTTLVIRIKGGDLSAFRAGRLTPAQVRARVEVSEF